VGEIESVGELARRMDRHERAMIEALRAIREQCASILAATVNAQVYSAERAHREAELTAVRAEIDKLDGRLTWAFRTAVAGVLFPVIVAVLVLVLTATRGGAP
jgi:ubiquinone biosynthesis protein UbiJ